MITLLLNLVFVGGCIALIYTLRKKLKSEQSFTPKNESNDLAFHFDVSRPWQSGGKRPIEVVNPFRGILISGSVGSGKSKSIIEPVIQQSVRKNYTGILYDYESPVLSSQVWSAFRNNKSDVRDFYVNFADLTRSHRINPLNPKFMTMSAYAYDYADTVLSNFSSEFIRQPNFFTRSSKSLYAAAMWYLKEEKPEYCTLPHASAMILTTDIPKLLERLSENDEAQAMIASVASGIESKNQTAGVIGTLQNIISPLLTPNIFWVLSGNELTLDLNNPNEKKFLTVANTPPLSSTFGPPISLIFSAALQQMNQQGKHQSVCVIDELPTMYIPNLDKIPATARKNRISTILAVQDFAQLEDKYTDKKAEVILSVMGNQFFGKTTNMNTAERVSKMFGTYDKEIWTKSYTSSGMPKALDMVLSIAGQGGKDSESRTQSFQTKPRVKPEEVVALQTGEFLGTIVDSWKNEFKTAMKAQDHPIVPMDAFSNATREKVQENFKRIKEEAQAIVDGTL